MTCGCEGGGGDDGPAGYLSSPRKRGPSLGVVKSAKGGAEEDVQE